MSANVESMLYTRTVPWHGLGTRVEEAPSSADALKLAGLDWKVLQSNVHTPEGAVIPHYRLNYRDTDNQILGIVSDKYRVVQNSEAFEFTDALLNDTEVEVKYETAGSLANGKRVWMLARLPKTTILGDDVDPFLCFQNTHDGTGAIRVFMTPIRVVCQNTLNVAMSTAKRSWSTIHKGNIQYKLEEAKQCLSLASKYLCSLDEMAYKYAEAALYKEEIDHMLSELFPFDEKEDSERKRANIEKLKSEYQICYMMPDIKQYRNTAWGAINAMSDMLTHNKPIRNTKNFEENRWGTIMNGHPVFDKFVKMINDRVGVGAW